MKKLFEFVTEHIPCVTAFVGDPLKAGISLLSLGLAVFFFLQLRRENLGAKARTAFIYAHLATLIFPLVFFAFSMTCQYMLIPCDKMNPLNIILYSIPITIAFAAFVLFVLIPSAYFFSNKARRITEGHLAKFWGKSSGRRQAPRLYSLDTSNPVAFSFSGLRPAVFVSVGLRELMNKKEIEAVLLHELAHISRKASLLKPTALLFRLFSPLSAFHSLDKELSEEERLADDFVARVQGTRKHLDSAKRKLAEYENEKESGKASRKA